MIISGRHIELITIVAIEPFAVLIGSLNKHRASDNISPSTV